MIFLISLALGFGTCQGLQCGQVEQCEVVQTLQELVKTLQVQVQGLQTEVDALKTKVFPTEIPASCHELGLWGTTADGIYTIQPASDVEPFEVECVFNGNVGTTIVRHDHMTPGITSTPLQTDGCSEPGCFTDEFKYNATLGQLEQLTTISAECTQEIFHNCTMNKLTGYSWWTDRYGEEREYWHGSYGDGTVGCYCSLEGDGCEDEHFDDLICNCDDLDETDVDEGILSNRDQLPVTSLNYGDSSSRYSWIIYELGHLECKGKSMEAIYPSEERDIDYFFKYHASSSWSMPGSYNYIIMTKPAIDKSMTFYNPTDGSFTAPLDGLYEFNLNLALNVNNPYRVYIQVDGNPVDQMANSVYYSENNRSSKHMTTQTSLQKGSVVRVYVSSSSSAQTSADCKINLETVGCSFFQGKLLRKY